MKSPIIPLLVLLVFSVSCSRYAAQNEAARSADSGAVNIPPQESKAATAQNYGTPKVSLTDVDKAELTNEAADRKIIRNAEITMEVASTTDAQHRVTSIAESHGGFVITSEAKQRENVDPSKRTLDIKLVVRIPSGSALRSTKSSNSRLTFLKQT